MSLHDLSASDLAKIDAICLDYESEFREGKAPDISELVAEQGGELAQELRRELECVRDELLSSNVNPSAVETDPGPVASSPSGDRDAKQQPRRSLFSTREFASIELPRTGTKIGPYLIGSRLGQGGMGVVFAAIDTRLDRKVAIKVLAIEIAKRADLTERFERESRAVAAISHPNIVELFDVGVANGLPYAVMEFLDGELLDALLQRGSIEPQEVRRLGAQVADALATAHKANVIHRDLKPHNIMLVPRSGGEAASTDFIESSSVDVQPRSTNVGATMVKLFDFGLSRSPDFGFDGTAEQTGDGVVLGTPGYMAPEQVRGERVTPSADLFSLGCVLFEAFYGKLAFDGATKAARFSAAVNDHPVADPIRRRADIELADLIDHCLQKDAADRPESAAWIAQQLRKPTADERTKAQIANRTVTGMLTRRQLVAIAGAGVGAAAVGAFFLRGDADQLHAIRSLAVLSFTDTSRPESVGPLTMPGPVGDAELHRGEQLASLLVHELTRLSEVTVPAFRPLVAETPREFRAVGEMLEVDAILTGRMRTVQVGTTQLLELDLRIVSAKTGSELWGQKIQTDAGSNLLVQSKLATEIASVIGQRLTSTAEEVAPPSVESFNCLLDGKTRSDPDSQVGLEMALMCFQKARRVDRRFADPVAGIALTSITLAAQKGTEDAVKLIRQARESAEEALQLDPKSRDARLAVAMLDWQTVGRYRQAERSFQELVMVDPNNWQVRYQFGLLQLALGRHGDAARSLREASQLNPMSLRAKVDRARAEWYSGNVERAIDDASRLRDKYDQHPFTIGLLIDIHEHRGRFDLAAAADPSFSWTPADSAPADSAPADSAPADSQEDYLNRRRLRLTDVPYGPYGVACNEAILQCRTDRGIDDFLLAELTDPMPPMLPLLLAAHPSFAAARLLPRASEILPDPTLRSSSG